MEIHGFSPFFTASGDHGQRSSSTSLLPTAMTQQRDRRKRRPLLPGRAPGSPRSKRRRRGGRVRLPVARGPSEEGHSHPDRRCRITNCAPATPCQSYGCSTACLKEAHRFGAPQRPVGPVPGCGDSCPHALTWQTTSLRQTAAECPTDRQEN